MPCLGTLGVMPRQLCLAKLIIVFFIQRFASLINEWNNMEK